MARPAHTVPDILWPSSNAWGVPDLDPAWQAQTAQAPFAAWGSLPRRGRHRGTWHFYVDDYKFNGLWADPATLLRTRAVCACEVNYSTAPEMPPIVAWWGIYRKRWLARYWQSCGLRVLVDLNVDERFEEDNLAGVPRGWSAFATRASWDGLEALERQHQAAARIALMPRPLFLVFSGGASVRRWCAEHGAIHVPDYQGARRWAEVPEVPDELDGQQVDRAALPLPPPSLPARQAAPPLEL